MRPIDADVLLETLGQWQDHAEKLRPDDDGLAVFNHGVMALAQAAAAQIPTLTIDDLRPKGHYITNDDGDSSCSECGENYLDITQNYCPNCGAKIGGGE